MVFTVRLSDDEAEALRRRAELENRSAQDVARAAVLAYLERARQRDVTDRVMDSELVRYADALRRLGH